MATRDNRSNQLVKLVHNAVIATDTTTDATVVDTADFDRGITFALAVLAFTDGVYTLQFEDSPDNSVFTAVSADKLIGPGASLSAITDASVPDDMATVGLFSTDRYVKAQIVSTGTTSGATIAVTAILSGEELPVAAQS